MEEASPLLSRSPPRKDGEGAAKDGADAHLSNPHMGLVDVGLDKIVDAKAHCMKGWYSVIAVFVILFLACSLLAGLTFVRVFSRGYIFELRSTKWWLLAGIAHIPYYFILFFLVCGVIERIGFVMIDCNGDPDDKNHRELPKGKHLPLCCVQLAMYNEHEVAERIIEATCCIDWPREKFEVQVLDDSTDPEVARRVDACVHRMVHQWGINCTVRRRINRKGYKAGALEEGRKETKAEFLALFDADFMPTKDYLKRAIPHFYENGVKPIPDLALVQCQWGHLNPFLSFLTTSQSLWIDDHHTVQMAWRSRVWNFVNFTGTAGVWRASAIEAAGGWRSASLVEDCELSFRTLFTGYRTKFVNSIVQPAELPDSVTAYKAQQKRWTQGWVQLWRMHFYHLLFVYRCGLVKRIALIYHMLIVWQWPIWSLWFFEFPFLVWFGVWFGELEPEGTMDGWMLFYSLPMLSWLILMTVLASLKTKHTYAQPLTVWTFLGRTIGRLVPYLVLNTGMLPHQLCSFMDGYLEDLHAEFERTPKKGDATLNNTWDAYVSGNANKGPRQPGAPAALADASDKSSGSADANGAAAGAAAPKAVKTQARIHWYVYAEWAFVFYQLSWLDLYFRYKKFFPLYFGLYQALSMLLLLAAYGDDRGSDFYSRLDRANSAVWSLCCPNKDKDKGYGEKSPRDGV